MAATYDRRLAWLLAALLSAYCVYAAAFIWRTSFVIDGVRTFSLFDDAMISMRYAKHLAAGDGLVWNLKGPPVEGFSNPLWVAYMAALHLIPLSPSTISLLVQTSGALLMVITLGAVACLAARLSEKSRLAVIVAVALTGSSLSLNTWALQGMEVSAVAAVITVAAWLAVREPSRPSRWSIVLLAVGTWIRLDVAVAFAIFVAWAAWSDPHRRRQHLIGGLGLLLVSLATQTALRWWYFGALLPNTYYLKMTGFPLGLRLVCGLYVLVVFTGRTVLGLAPVLPGLRFLRRDRATVLLASIVGGQVAYSIWVGGDAWERTGLVNRYIAVALPALYILLGVALARWRVSWCRESTTAARRTRHLAVALALMATIGAGVAPAKVAGSWLLLEPSLHVVDNAAQVRLARWLDRCTNAATRIAVVWAGTIPYLTDRETIDLLGKTDARLAREPMHQLPDSVAFLTRATFFWPGHRKYDYDYTIGLLEPDIVTDVWGVRRDTLSPLLSYVPTRVGDTLVYVRPGTPLRCPVDFARRSLAAH